MLVRTGKGEEFAVIVGEPKEVKDNEFRVAATPEGVLELTHAGRRVLVQDGAGRVRRCCRSAM